MSRSHISLDRALKMLSKHGTVQHQGQGYYTRINGQIVGFFKNGEDGTTCYHTRRIGMESDPITDYDANNYWDNLTQAIRYAETGHSRA